MARTATPTILRWGTPPEPLTGWELVRRELEKKPGNWAELGPVSKATIHSRLPGRDGFEHRFVKADEGKPTVWVRYVTEDDERRWNAAAELEASHEDELELELV